LLDEGNADSQHELRLLEGKVGAAQLQLDSINAELGSLRSARKLAVDERDRMAKQAAEQASLVQSMVEERQAELAGVGQQVKAAKKEVRAIDTERSNRKKYLAQQEELIEATTQEGNQQLAALNRQIAEFEGKKEELLRNLNTIEANIADGVKRVDELEEKLDTLRERYEITAVKYRGELAASRAAMVDATERTTRMNEGLEAKQLELKTKESELNIRADVLAKRAEEVEGEKRKLDSKKALYGIL
jgi:chromosome segregation ATPase